MKTLVWRSLRSVDGDYLARARRHYGFLFSFAKSYSKQDLQSLLAKAGATAVVVQEKGEPGPYTIAWPNEPDDSRRIVYIEATPAKDTSVPTSLPWPVHKFDVLSAWEQVELDAPDPPPPPASSSYARAAVVTLALGATVFAVLFAKSRGYIAGSIPPLV